MAGACAASGTGAPASSSCANPAGLAHLQGHGRAAYLSWKPFTDQDNLCVAPGAEHARRPQEVSCHPGGCVLLAFDIPGHFLFCVEPHQCQPASCLPHRLLGAHSHTAPAQCCWSHNVLSGQPPAWKLPGRSSLLVDPRRRVPSKRSSTLARPTGRLSQMTTPTCRASRVCQPPNVLPLPAWRVAHCLNVACAQRSVPGHPYSHRGDNSRALRLLRRPHCGTHLRVCLPRAPAP